MLFRPVQSDPTSVLLWKNFLWRCFPVSLSFSSWLEKVICTGHPSDPTSHSLLSCACHSTGLYLFVYLQTHTLFILAIVRLDFYVDKTNNLLPTVRKRMKDKVNC